MSGRAGRLLDRFLGRVVRRGRLTVTHADGRVTRFGTAAPDYPEVAIRLTDGRAARDILLDPRVGAGEAFMDGRLVVEEGDVMALVGLLRGNAPWEGKGKLHAKGPLRRLAGRAVAAVDQVNGLVASRRHVAAHYDLGNDFYRLWLDEDWQYSCAYWPRDGMTLEEAQRAKLAHVAAKLALEPGHAVLDIGCGWGGMALFLAERAGVHVHGITLSEEQLALARERAEERGLADRVTFELVDYRELAARDAGRFDRIVSVGMFEHVGARNFETFFRACRALMTADGVMLLHTIGRMGGPGTTDAFTRKHVFPGGYIPALGETVAASERARLMVTDVETWRLHYARTLRQWYARCVARREEIVALHDERLYRMWLFYLAGATAAFEHGGMVNYQIQYARDRRALPITRDYMADAERRLLG